MKFRRAFNWGVIVVGDADTEVPADLAHDGVGRGVNALALGVRHSSDVELDDFGPDDVVPSFDVDVDVDVEVIVGSPPHRGAIEHVIRLPSGIIHVGDAEAEEEINVRPGQFQLTIDVDDRAHPGAVRVWITEAASD